MIIPADSVLLSIGHQYDDDDLDKGIDLRNNKIMIVSEEVLSGDPSYKEKNVIKKRSCKEFIEQFKTKAKKPHEISNILYANTYCIKGEGIAIACAVGTHTCYGTRKGCDY
jgi:magnesium-transporting ATPase (P-type)